MDEKMTLGSIRAQIREIARVSDDMAPAAVIEWHDLIAWGHTIDAHLATPAQTVDVEAIKDVIRGLKGINYTIWADKLAQAIGDKL